VSAAVQLLRSEKVMHLVRLPFLRIPEYWDDLVYKLVTPRITGIPLHDLSPSTT
jgi:hypothetical protein